MTHRFFPHGLHFSSIYQLMLLMKTDKDRLGKKIRECDEIIVGDKECSAKTRGDILDGGVCYESDSH